MKSTIRDVSLAPEGERKIQWVAQHAHTLNSFAAERLSDGALRGRRIAIAVHLEAKTAYLAWLLREAGAEVAATGSNPFSTQDDVCAALVRRGVKDLTIVSNNCGVDDWGLGLLLRDRAGRAASSRQATRPVPRPPRARTSARRRARRRYPLRRVHARGVPACGRKSIGNRAVDAVAHSVRLRLARRVVSRRVARGRR